MENEVKEPALKYPLISQEDYCLTRVSLAGSVYGSPGSEFFSPHAGLNEGISYNPSTKTLFHMDGDGDMQTLEKVSAIADWGRLHYGSYRHYETYPRSTVWSMGASIHWTDTTGDTQQAFLSMSNSTMSTQRATVLFRTASDRLGFWNSTDGWIESDIDLNYKSQFRLAAQHNGTTQRKLFYNGILKATDNTIGNRPTGSGSNMDFVVNASQTDGHENGEGYYQFVWARNDYASDAWMAADAAAMNSPYTFYTIT